MFICLTLAPFRTSVPSRRLIKQLHQNSLVSLENDEIMFEKVKINIMKNPNTIFLTATNRACDIINQFCVETLFENQPIVATIVNGNKQVINIYRNQAMIITENRYYKISV